MTAEERSAKWLADIEEVERMTSDKLRAECRTISKQGGFLGVIAQAALSNDEDRNQN